MNKTVIFEAIASYLENVSRFITPIRCTKFNPNFLQLFFFVSTTYDSNTPESGLSPVFCAKQVEKSLTYLHYIRLNDLLLRYLCMLSDNFMFLNIAAWFLLGKTSYQTFLWNNGFLVCSNFFSH